MLSWYRVFVGVAYERAEAKAAPTGDLDNWCIAGDTSRPQDCYLAGFRNDGGSGGSFHFRVPDSAYTYPTAAPALNYKPANDTILVTRNTGFSRNSVNPLRAELMTEMKASGLFAPYLFLRWSLNKPVICPKDLFLSPTRTDNGTVFACVTTPVRRGVPDLPLAITTDRLPA